MTPEEQAVIRAAIQLEHDGTPVPVAFSDTVRALIYSCHQCNTDMHLCPGCGVNLYHGDSACDDCMVHDAVAPVLDENGRFTMNSVVAPDSVGLIKAVAALTAEQMEDAPGFVESVETALAAQSESPGDHPCENCLTDPDEDPAPWCDCRPDETCSGPCRRKAHDPTRCPNLPSEAALAVWVPTILLYCLAGDRIRIGTDETIVRRSSSGVWYVNAADYWHPTPWKHTELRLDLEANPGFQEYPPNTPCELLCGPSRLTVLELQKAFPGTTEVSRRRNR